MELKTTINAKLLAHEILSSGIIKDISGKEYLLNSSIDTKEGLFLEQIVQKNNFYKTLEIGCAYGISSLFICAALSKEGSHHTIIDPYQASDWNNIGITQLQNAGCENYVLVEEKSEYALPKLVAQGEQFDFAFIDGWHTFDHTLLDMFYINRLLRTGGIIVVDDVGMPAVQRAVNYFLKYPAYSFEGGVVLDVQTNKRKLFNKFIINPLKSTAKMLPKKWQEEIFNHSLVGNIVSGYSMVAIKKISEDERPWNWYESF